MTYLTYHFKAGEILLFLCVDWHGIFMVHVMKGSWFPIIFVTAYLAVYVVLSYYSFEYIVYAMFAISPFLVIWMVYRVLRYGTPSERTFSEYFYDDMDHRRIPEDN